MERTDIITDIETTGLDPLKDRSTALGIEIGEGQLIFNEDDERFNLWIRSKEILRKRRRAAPESDGDKNKRITL